MKLPGTSLFAGIVQKNILFDYKDLTEKGKEKKEKHKEVQEQRESHGDIISRKKSTLLPGIQVDPCV